MDYAACSRAADHGIKIMEAAGAFARGSARAPAYKADMFRTLRGLYIRFFGGSGEEGAEAHTHYATARGTGMVSGLKKSAGHERLAKFAYYGLIDLACPKQRKGEADADARAEARAQGKPESKELVANPLHWCPYVWRIGPAVREFFADLRDTGTNLAAPPLGSHDRTCIPPSGGGFSPTILPSPDSGSKRFQNESRDVSGLEKLLDKDRSIDSAYEPPKPAISPVPCVPLKPATDSVEVLALAETAIQSMAVRYEPDNPVHPEGRDLAYALSGCATPAVWQRIARRNGIDWSARVRFHAKAARVLRAMKAEDLATALPPPPPDNPALRAACQGLEQLPSKPAPKPVRPPRPEVPKVRPLMPHPMGHNGPPEPTTPSTAEPEPERDLDGKTEVDRTLDAILARVFRAGPS